MSTGSTAAAVRALHHGVVDGGGGRARERLLSEAQEAQVLARVGQRLPGGVQDGGLEAGQLVEEGAGGEDEDAAVPGVGAGLEVGGGGLPVRLLREGFDGIGAVEARQRRAAPDVAVAGVRPARRDAEQHELACARHLGGAAAPPTRSQARP